MNWATPGVYEAVAAEKGEVCEGTVFCPAVRATEAEHEDETAAKPI